MNIVTDLYSRKIILYIIQIATLYNAKLLGWNIRKIGERKYELSKELENPKTFHLDKFLSQIVP